MCHFAMGLTHCYKTTVFLHWYNPDVTFLVILFFFSVTRPGRTVATILTLNGSNDVFPPKEVPFGGQDDGWRHMGKYFPKTPQKGEWIGSFKPKRQNFYIAISPELLIGRSSDLRTEFSKTTKGTSWVVRHYPKANTTWLTAAILEIDMTSYFSGGCSDLDEIRQPGAE